jgi:hypothetical protein
VPEFTFTPFTDQDDIKDGLFMGHLDVSGSAGSVTTRSSRPSDKDWGVVLFPVVIDLLDGLAGLLERGRGKFTSTDMGLPMAFILKGQVMTIRRWFTVIDESSPQAVADAVWAAAQRLVDSHLRQVTEATKYIESVADGFQPIDYRAQVPAAMARLQKARTAFGG